jgi:hypothetical protein
MKSHPVIDVHGHWGQWFFAMDIGAVSENLRVMDEWGINLQIVSASEAVTYDAPGGNAKLARILETQPRLRGYVVCNPNDLAAAESDLRRFLSTDAFVGVKIHTSYSQRAISGPQMRDLFALLNDFDAVVLIHTWGGDVLDLPRLLANNPRLRVIAAHMGANRWDLAAEAARECRRLYLEPSCSVTDAGQVAHVAARVPASQLLFGTDATLIDPAVSFGLVEDAGLAPAVAEAMYWRNAAELFGLPQSAA